LVVTIFTALPAIIVYWNRGDISWLPAALVLVGSMMGARIGSKMSLRTKPFWLELGFLYWLSFWHLLSYIYCSECFVAQLKIITIQYLTLSD